MQSFKKIALWGISIASLGLASQVSAVIYMTGPNQYQYSIASSDMNPADGYTFFTDDAGPPEASIESLFVRVLGTTADTVSLDMGVGIVVDFSATATPGYYTSTDSTAITRFASAPDGGRGFIVRAPDLMGATGIGYNAVAPEPSDPPLAIELVSYDGTNLVVNVTGGLPDRTYKITSSTDLTLPFDDTGVTFDAATATGISVPSGSNTRFFVRAEEVKNS